MLGAAGDGNAPSLEAGRHAIHYVWTSLAAVALRQLCPGYDQSRRGATQTCGVPLIPTVAARSGSELDAGLGREHEHRAASAVELVADLSGDDHMTVRRAGL